MFASQIIVLSSDFVSQDPKVLKSLTCRYKRGRMIPYVQYKEETLSWDPRISMFYDVISDTEAELIKQLATPLVSFVGFFTNILFFIFLTIQFLVSFFWPVQIN